MTFPSKDNGTFGSSCETGYPQGKNLSPATMRASMRKATPGDLSFVLPYRHLKSMIEMLEALDQITPGIFSGHTLLYGIEVKFYTNRVKISSTLEMDIKNTFLIGDGAGITRGLMQASICGILAANEILKRMGKEQGYLFMDKFLAIP